VEKYVGTEFVKFRTVTVFDPKMLTAFVVGIDEARIWYVLLFVVAPVVISVISAYCSATGAIFVDFPSVPLRLPLSVTGTGPMVTTSWNAA
jgi:hypothetical protein